MWPGTSGEVVFGHSAIGEYSFLVRGRASVTRVVTY
jgi:hypothetical protein